MRIGFIGAGRIGAAHVATVARHPAVTEVLVADLDAGRARAVAARTGTTAAASVDAVFTPSLDAVMIAAPTAVHADLIIRAAEVGLPVFCEKPVACDLADTRDVLARVDKAGIAVHVGFQRRFDAGYREARAAVGSGRLGRVQLVHLVTADAAPPHHDYIATSGGIYRDCHIHDFDIVRWVTGREVVEVYATGANRGEEFFRAAGDVDNSAAVLSLDDGTLATVHGSRYNGFGYDVRMEVSGSAGSLVVGLDDRAPVRSAEPGVAFPAGAPYSDFLDRFVAAYEAEIAAFVEMVMSDEPSPCPIEDALAALLVAEACDLSRRERRPIRIEEIT